MDPQLHRVEVKTGFSQPSHSHHEVAVCASARPSAPVEPCRWQVDRLWGRLGNSKQCLQGERRHTAVCFGFPRFRPLSKSNARCNSELSSLARCPV